MASLQPVQIGNKISTNDLTNYDLANMLLASLALTRTSKNRNIRKLLEPLLTHPRVVHYGDGVGIFEVGLDDLFRSGLSNYMLGSPNNLLTAERELAEVKSRTSEQQRPQHKYHEIADRILEDMRPQLIQYVGHNID